MILVEEMEMALMVVRKNKEAKMNWRCRRKEKLVGGGSGGDWWFGWWIWLRWLEVMMVGFGMKID